MAAITFHPSDAALAERIRADLAVRVLAGHDNTAIFVFSQHTAADADVQRALAEAVERHQRIIPVLAQRVPLPRLIEHLQPVDFSQNYDFQLLADQLTGVTRGLQMKVLTPQAAARNRQVGLVVAAAALLMFLAGLYGVGVLGIQAPAEEYNAVETEIIETRNAYIDAALPRSTEDAANFQATLDSAAPTLRPLLAATATALAGK